MRRFRFALLALLLAAVSQPLLALGCPQCHESGSCIYVLEPGLKCKVTIDGCTDGFIPCGGAFSEPLDSEWQIAAVEVRHQDAPAVREEAQPVLARREPLTK